MEYTVPDVRPGQLCAFTTFFPSRRDLQDKLLTIERDDGVSADPEMRLMPLLSTPIDFSRLSWNTRPSPLTSNNYTVTLTASFGDNQTSSPFPCPSSSLFRVQAMCIGKGCRVEYDASPVLVDVPPMLGTIPAAFLFCMS